MATFDQLPAEQRAIIELVVQRGRSYQSLADVLEIPPGRVRELARDALTELAPVTAARVDPEWRGQLADYLLGQQSGPESTATRAHLKRSEPARTWALSLLDALDPLYGNGSRPNIPEGDESASRPRERELRGRAAKEEERPLAAAAAPAALATAPPPSPATRTLEPELEPEPEPRRPLREPEPEPAAARRELSPEAQRVLRRRGIIAVVGGIVLLAAIVIGILTLTGTLFSSTSHKTAAASKASSGPPAQILGIIPLAAVGSSGASGEAVVAQKGSQRELIVQAKLKPSAQGYAYEVWLYNSPSSYASMGAQVTDKSGNYQGAGALPASFANYKYIDISYEQIGRSTAHNGPSVLRGAFANAQTPQQAAASSSGSAGGTAAP